VRTQLPHTVKNLADKVLSYITTVARFSSPALHKTSVIAEIRHCLLVELEGLNLLRKVAHERKMHISPEYIKALLDVN